MYFYYKNLVFAVPQFFYLFYNAYSSQTLFEDFYISFFNLFFTSWPVIIRAVFDQDIYYKKWTSKGPLARENHEKTLAYRSNLQTRFNYLYYVGQKNLLFNMKNILLWFFNSIIGALIIFYLTKEIFASDQINSEGQVQDIWFFSIILYTIIIFVVDLKLLMFTKHFNVFIFISVIIFSIILYIAYFFIADLISVFLIYKTAKVIISSVSFYLSLILILGILFMLDLFILSLDREINTPLYILFKSLIKKKKPFNDEKHDFEEITRQVNEKGEERN
jgi:magnesium-transporting ATPase (P-type)